MNGSAGCFQYGLPVGSSSVGSDCVFWGGSVQEGCFASTASHQVEVVVALDVLSAKPLYSHSYFYCFGNLELFFWQVTLKL